MMYFGLNRAYIQLLTQTILRIQTSVLFAFDEYVNLTKFFIYLLTVCLQKSVVENTQFCKQNRRKQIWAKIKSKRCKIIKNNCS